MMYVVEATNDKGWHWISGVFANREDAEAYFRAIPNDASG